MSIFGTMSNICAGNFCANINVWQCYKTSLIVAFATFKTTRYWTSHCTKKNTWTNKVSMGGFISFKISNTSKSYWENLTKVLTEVDFTYHEGNPKVKERTGKPPRNRKGPIKSKYWPWLMSVKQMWDGMSPKLEESSLWISGYACWSSFK